MFGVATEAQICEQLVQGRYGIGSSHSVITQRSTSNYVK